MFEGKLPRPAAAGPLDAEQVESDPLRLLSWNDLMSRLMAARELRTALRPPGLGNDASFDAGSARRIAAHANGKPAVNRDNSSNGKAGSRRATRVGLHTEPEVPAAPRGRK